MDTDAMRIKHLRDWSPDAVWITFAIVITLAAALVAYLVMPPP